MTDTVPAITVEAVSQRFGGVRALEDVSFSVTTGAIHAIIGPNGAGKSTCFNVISGLYKPSAGRVLFGTDDVTHAPTYKTVQYGIARTFQNIVLAPEETVTTNLLVARHSVMKGGVLSSGLRLPRYRRAERENVARITEIAEFLGIERHLSARVHTLPYGVQKKVELARALCAEPRVLMLDEPVAGMNAEETAEMTAAIRECREALDLTVVIIEHDMGMIMSLADEITVLDFGRVIARGTPDEVQNDPAVLAAYLGTRAAEAEDRSTTENEQE